MSLRESPQLSPGTEAGTDYYEVDQEGDYEERRGRRVVRGVLFAQPATGHRGAASWHDGGVEVLTEKGAVTGETDTYTWADLHSISRIISTYTP